MVVKVNGETKQLSMENPSLPDLLRHVGIPPEQSGIAVAINFEVVPRSQWAETQVNEGDEIEVITARQGG